MYLHEYKITKICAFISQPLGWLDTPPPVTYTFRIGVPILILLHDPTYVNPDLLMISSASVL